LWFLPLPDVFRRAHGPYCCPRRIAMGKQYRGDGQPEQGGMWRRRQLVANSNHVLETLSNYASSNLQLLVAEVGLG
jgi:hypothetical protein